MTKLSALIAGAVLLGVTAAWALEHHPFAAEFDPNKPVTLTGTLTKVDWTNPHVHAFIDVRDANGTVRNWDVEMGSPKALMRRGWKVKMLHVGEEVNVEGWRARDGSTRANAKSVNLNGRVLSAASSYADSRTAVGTGGKKE